MWFVIRIGVYFLGMNQVRGGTGISDKLITDSDSISISQYVSQRVVPSFCMTFPWVRICRHCYQRHLDYVVRLASNEPACIQEHMALVLYTLALHVISTNLTMSLKGRHHMPWDQHARARPVSLWWYTARDHVTQRGNRNKQSVNQQGLGGSYFDSMQPLTSIGVCSYSFVYCSSVSQGAGHPIVHLWYNSHDITRRHARGKV